jgi:hypothetical protein
MSIWYVRQAGIYKCEMGISVPRDRRELQGIP